MKNIGRKIYHLGGGVFLIGIYAFLGRPFGLAVLTAIFLGATALDFARLRSKSLNDFFFRHFSKFLRESEKKKLSGTPWYVLGVLCAAALYPLPVAVYAVMFLACGDVAATTVGERWGSMKFPGSVKSVQGSVAFFLAAFVAGLIIRSYFFPASLTAIAAGAFTAALVEVLPIKVNDNLTIPVISGAVMRAIGLL